MARLSSCFPQHNLVSSTAVCVSWNGRLNDWLGPSCLYKAACMKEAERGGGDGGDGGDDGGDGGGGDKGDEGELMKAFDKEMDDGKKTAA